MVRKDRATWALDGNLGHWGGGDLACSREGFLRSAADHMTGPRAVVGNTMEH